MDTRFDRSIRFFGDAGQRLLAEARVAVAGVGGLGNHIAQALAFYNVGTIVLIDNEYFDASNMNRYVLARRPDAIGFPPKVDLAEREILSINSDINVVKVHDNVISNLAFSELIKCNYIFGCFDREGVRFIMNELCAAYEIPYIDIATDIIKSNSLLYGGRIFVAWDGTACPMCMDVLDMEEVQKDLHGTDYQEMQQAIYGVSKELLGEKGPSVVSINGTVANYAATEFMLGATGVRRPITYAEYRGHDGKIVVNTDTPHSDCYYCKGIRGKREYADVERYIRMLGKQGLKMEG